MTEAGYEDAATAMSTTQGVLWKSGTVSTTGGSGLKTRLSRTAISRASSTQPEPARDPITRGDAGPSSANRLTASKTMASTTDRCAGGNHADGSIDLKHRDLDVAWLVDTVFTQGHDDFIGR